MQSIMKEILDNPINETVEGEYPKWRERIERIERSKITCKDHLNELERRKSCFLQKYLISRQNSRTY